MKCTERYIAKENQTEFKLNISITEDLLVHLNGSLIDSNDYYLIDTQTNTVFFNKPLEKGDSLVFEQALSMNSENIISYNSSNSVSLFYKYGSVEKLLNNNLYTVTIPLKNKSIKEIKWSFSTKLSPFISKISTIRRDTGELLEHVTDEIISKVIYSNSQEAVDLYQEYLDSDSNTSSVKTVDLTSLPKYVKSWVRYKTDIDLVYAAYLTIAGKYGSIVKKIGYLDIENSVKKPDLDAMLSLFQKKFDAVDEQLNNSSTAVNNCVKAGNTSYPINERNSF